MNAAYVSKVRSFGGAKPYVDIRGERKNLSHRTNLQPDEVETDGRGNVTDMPLLKGKPCFGRPERLIRGLFEGEAWYDEHGNRRPGETPCHRCEELCLGTFLACQNVASERIGTAPAIEAAFVDWIDATGNASGPVCFSGAHSRRWKAYLDAIASHGGWTNINDDQVKVAAITAAENDRKRRRENERVRRQRERELRASLGRPVTAEFLKSVDLERDRRAIHLKSLRVVRGDKPQDTLWLRNLPDETCERVANVWRAREVVERSNGFSSGKAIAEELDASGHSNGMTLATLQARVSDDLKRIKKLEDDTAGESLWGKWTFAQ